MKAASEKSKKFWDRLAPKYARQSIADQASYEMKLAMTQDYLKPDVRVLEFGCGTGSTALVHAAHVAEIDAIDISSEMIAIAQAKADEAGVTNVRFSVGDLESLAAPDNHYDAVLGLSVIHLLTDRPGALAAVRRALKPGGVYVSSTPCLADTMGYMRPFLAAGRMIGRFPYVGFFTKAQMEEELTDAGFKIVHQWQPAKGKAIFTVAQRGG